MRDWTRLFKYVKCLVYKRVLLPEQDDCVGYILLECVRRDIQFEDADWWNYMKKTAWWMLAEYFKTQQHRMVKNHFTQAVSEINPTEEGKIYVLQCPEGPQTIDKETLTHFLSCLSKKDRYIWEMRMLGRGWRAIGKDLCMTGENARQKFFRHLPLLKKNLEN